MEEVNRNISDGTIPENGHILAEEIKLESNLEGDDTNDPLPPETENKCKLEFEESSMEFTEEPIEQANVSLSSIDGKERCMTKTKRGQANAQKYKCDTCNYQTGIRYNFFRHIDRHKNFSDEQMYKCAECDYKTGLKDYFKRHQNKHKLVAKGALFTCDTCDFKTLIKPRLTKHQATKDPSDSGDQSYNCEVCDFRTVRKGCLAHHQLTHISVEETQTYKCKICDYRTISKSNFTKHHFKHEGRQVVPSYKCRACVFQTFRKRNLKRHEVKCRKLNENK